jgi:predicted phage terminase large subunit-like protein
VTAGLGVSPYEYAARYFEPKRRRYTTPGTLARAMDRRTGTSPALELIDRELVALAAGGRGDPNALMILMPPQEGKSQRASRRYPEWLLDYDPAVRIAIVSYEMDMALRWGRDIKQDIALSPCRHDPGDGGEDDECREPCGGLHISIRRDSSAAGRWETPEGGGVYCVGVGGPLTGKPVDVLVIDDPVKDRAWAESKVIRESTWDWWESVALTRLAPGGKVVLIQTRWHEDDLAGRITARPGPLRWRVVKIPAIATRPDDPLGRSPGEELVSVRGREPGHFIHLKATTSNYVFSGVYQQEPTAAEGNFFRRATFRYWRDASGVGVPGRWIDLEGRRVHLDDPAVWRFATVDVAASEKTSADWTVVSVWAITRDGDLILLDRARGRAEMADHFAMVAPLRAVWRFDVCYVEHQFYSKTLVADARAAGIPVAEVTADADKVTRAIPAAGRTHAGKAWFPAGAAWLEEWCDELASFPQGAHDDQVDTFSYAARIAAAHWTPAPPPSSPRPALPDAIRQIEQAYAAATGDGRRELNLLDLPY